jgi:hypothetical protein
MSLLRKRWRFFVGGVLSVGLLALVIYAVDRADSRLTQTPTEAQVAGSTPTLEPGEYIAAPGPPSTPPVPPGYTGPVNIIAPTLPANPGPLQTYAGFRLIPFGYVGPIPHTDDPSTGVPPNWRNLLKPPITDLPALWRSTLYKEPSTLPAGYILKSGHGEGTDGSNLSVKLVFEGPRFPLVVSRQLVIRRPVDVYLFAPPQGDQRTSTVVTGSVLSGPAVFTKVMPGREFQGPLIIQFIEGSTLTVLEWRVSDPANAEAEFQELLWVAESLVISPNAVPTTLPSPPVVVTPPPGNYARGTVIGNQAVDKFLENIYAADWAKLAEEAQFTPVPCKAAATRDVPECLANMAVGTPLPFLLYGACNPNYVLTKEMLRERFTNTITEPLRLYAVFKPKELFGIKPSFAVILRAVSPQPQPSLARTFFIDDNGSLVGALNCSLQWPPESGQAVVWPPVNSR